MKHTPRIIGFLLLTAFLAACSSGARDEAATGTVKVSFSTADDGRTVIPTTPPVFSSYAVTFSAPGKTSVSASGKGALSQALAPGVWTLSAEASATYTPTGGTAAPYKAAAGNAEVTIAAGATTSVAVTLSPLPITSPGAPKGIFTYTVTYPANVVSAIISVYPNGSATPVSDLSAKPIVSGTPVSLELAAAYYDFRIEVATNAGKTAGLFNTVHIYPGLQSVFTQAFTDADFAADDPASKALRGIITTAIANTPLGGALVTVKQGATTIDTATTAANGLYNFPLSAAGSYTLTVSKNDYLEKTLTVAVSSGPVTTDVALFPNLISVDFGSAGTKALDFSGAPAGKKVYLVTVNRNTAAAAGGSSVAAASSASPPDNSERALPDSPAFSDSSLLFSGGTPPGHHSGAVAFNANPPPITPDMLKRTSSRAVPAYTVDSSTKDFFVETYNGSAVFEEKTAILRGQGAHSNVWVIENWGTPLANNTAARTLADKFDLMYEPETKILGYEYGGGPGGNGGKDGDSRVQILVYDFMGATGQSTNTAGFYWGKDFYNDGASGLGSLRSNEAEIFYINTSFLNTKPDFIASTLVHEFQHMIHFNVKNVKCSLSSATWYNEMLSMMAEDMLDSFIDILPTNEGHPIVGRMSGDYGFLKSYKNEGVEKWGSGQDALYSYSYKYAFGAYLARNYGGAELVQKILANNTTNASSVLAAVKLTSGNSGLVFADLVEKFAEAFIFTDAATSHAGFNKTVTKTISGFDYTFTGFNIWAASYNLTVPAASYVSWGGPTVYALSASTSMEPYSVYVQSGAASVWQTGALNSVTLSKPANGVKLFLMIR